MISKKLEQTAKINSICLMDTHPLKKGIRFKELTVLNKERIIDGILSSDSFYCHGISNGEELLLSTSDNRYYFTIKDGWGAVKDHLYAISIGMCIDFKTPTSTEDMEQILSQQMNPKSTFGAIAENGKRKKIQKILSILKEK